MEKGCQIHGCGTLLTRAGLATVSCDTSSPRAISALGTPRASISRISRLVSRGTVVFPLLRPGGVSPRSSARRKYKPGPCPLRVRARPHVANAAQFPMHAVLNYRCESHAVPIEYKHCERFGLVRSMSRKGTSPDDARAEGFFGTLKREFFRGRDWSGWALGNFMAELDAWLRRFNSGRARQTPGWFAPDEHREAALDQAAHVRVCHYKHVEGDEEGEAPDEVPLSGLVAKEVDGKHSSRRAAD